MLDTPLWQQCRRCDYREFAAEVPALGLRRDETWGVLCHQCWNEFHAMRLWGTPIPWLREPG